MKYKTNYAQEFENQLGNPSQQLDDLIAKAHTLKIKQKFIERFGEDPVDVLGNDWENYLDEYLEEVNNEEEYIDRL